MNAKAVLVINCAHNVRIRVIKTFIRYFLCLVIAVLSGFEPE